MLAYPGYTRDRIRSELSWRDIKDLMDQWEEHPPVFVDVRRSNTMLSKKWGFRWEKRKPLSGQALVEKLQGMGWL